MRRQTALAFHVAAVLVGFALVLEGFDLLLIALLEAHLWLPIGLLSGLLSLPVLARTGTAFAPPWMLPAFVKGASLTRAAALHAVCCVLGTWLWTAPTLSLIGILEGRTPTLITSVETMPSDPVAIGIGLVLAALAFSLPAAVLFVRLSTFRTDFDSRTVRLSALVRPTAVALGGYLTSAVVVSFALAFVTVAG